MLWKFLQAILCFPAVWALAVEFIPLGVCPLFIFPLLPLHKTNHWQVLCEGRCSVMGNLTAAVPPIQCPEWKGVAFTSVRDYGWSVMSQRQSKASCGLRAMWRKLCDAGARASQWQLRCVEDSLESSRNSLSFLELHILASVLLSHTCGYQAGVGTLLAKEVLEDTRCVGGLGMLPDPVHTTDLLSRFPPL